MRSSEVEQLITDLRAEKPRGRTIVNSDSKMVIVLDETAERLTFNSAECELLLANRATVERLFEALDYPDETFVELHDIVVDNEVVAQLESYASTVDEM